MFGSPTADTLNAMAELYRAQKEAYTPAMSPKQQFILELIGVLLKSGRWSVPEATQQAIESADMVFGQED